MSQRQHSVPTSALVDGFKAAHERFKASMPGADEAFRAIFEVLAWAGAIRDRLRDDAITSPPIIDGLWYMRNVILHQGADVLPWLYEPAGMVGTMKLGVSDPPLKSWQWPYRGDFDPPISTVGQSEYVSTLEGEDAISTLEQTSIALGGLGI
jgi:hypothetical protein